MPNRDYTETEFEAFVVDLLREEYPDATIRQQVHLSDGREADVLLDTGRVEFALELEDESYDELASRGQSDHYAMKRRQERLGALVSAPDTDDATHANVVPVQCVPAGTIDPSERSTTQLDGVLVWEIDDSPLTGD